MFLVLHFDWLLLALASAVFDFCVAFSSLLVWVLLSDKLVEFNFHNKCFAFLPAASLFRIRCCWAGMLSPLLHLSHPDILFCSLRIDMDFAFSLSIIVSCVCVSRFALAISSSKTCLSSWINLRIASFSAFFFAIVITYSRVSAWKHFTSSRILRALSASSLLVAWWLQFLSSVCFLISTSSFSCVTCSLVSCLRVVLVRCCLIFAPWNVLCNVSWYVLVHVVSTLL